MFCSLSGEPPQTPVLSPKSGHIYERRLIEKYIAENGTDPNSGDKLALEDLIAIKTSTAVAPRPPALTSIPALLHTLQNEWDALVLEQFSLKQQYNAVRQELSHSLYQYDAATRVAARLLKERDASREALASVQAAMGVAPAPVEAATDVEMGEAAPQEQSGPLPANIEAEVAETQKTLSAIRKKKAKPAATYATPAQVRTYTSKQTIPSLHASSPAGLTALALSTANPSQFLTGGNDKIVQIYDRESDKVVAALKGHTKKITHVAWREPSASSSDVTPLVISGSADKTVRIWAHDASSGEYAPAHTVKLHKGEITGLAVHPTNTLLGVSSLDKTYSLHSLSTFQSIFQSPAGSGSPYTSLEIHPDGVLVALGTARATVQIYDVRTGQLAVELTPSSDNAESAGYSVHTTSFSENGFHLAAPDTSASVAIWDLRKPKIINTLPLSLVGGAPYRINRIKYDVSAQFLGVAGTGDVRVLANKTWEELARFEHSAGVEVADFVFGKEARDIWTASGREVRVWGAPDA